jgi:hypothetical protein
MDELDQALSHVDGVTGWRFMYGEAGLGAGSEVKLEHHSESTRYRFEPIEMPINRDLICS